METTNPARGLYKENCVFRPTFASKLTLEESEMWRVFIQMSGDYYKDSRNYAECVCRNDNINAYRILVKIKNELIYNESMLYNVFIYGSIRILKHLIGEGMKLHYHTYTLLISYAIYMNTRECNNLIEYTLSLPDIDINYVVRGINDIHNNIYRKPNLISGCDLISKYPACINQKFAGTIMYAACCFNNIYVINLLLVRHDLRALRYFRYMILTAFIYSSWSTVDSLINWRIKINPNRSIICENLLMMAYTHAKSNMQIISNLIKSRYIDINYLKSNGYSKGCSVLHMACCDGNVEVTKLILSHPNINVEL